MGRPASILLLVAVLLAFAGRARAGGALDTIPQLPLQENIEELLEYVEPENTGGDAEQLTQLLQELAAHPVNVNTARQEDLLQVPGLNLKLVQGIIAYREQVKPFESTGELLEVTGIGEVTMKKIIPFVTVGSGFALEKKLYSDYRYWTHEGRFQMYTRYQQDLQQAEGYRQPPAEGGYLGGPGKYYQRVGYRSRHLSMNLTQEKDAGEMFDSPVQLDHNVWHIALQDNGPLPMLVAGDYSLSFGQGLVLWNGGMFGKGSDVTGAVNRKGRGIRPYTSTREDGYFRGVAATAGHKLRVSGFYSDRRLSSSVVSSDTLRYPRSDGNHRTMSERAGAGNQRQRLWGGNVQVEFPFAVVGATGYQTVFDHYITPGSGTYARYDFAGTMHAAKGIDYKLLAGPAVFFGEAARSHNGGSGLISGVESALGQDTNLTIVYRNYQKNFQSLLGRGFSERSGNPQNEEGIYVGLRHSLGKRMIMSGYMDQYTFPAARFGLNRPSRGYEWLSKVEVVLAPGLEAYLQLRSDQKGTAYEIPDVFGRTLRQMGDSRRRSIRGHLQYQVNSQVRFRTRAEVVQSRSPGAGRETGYLLYQDVRLSFFDPLSLDMRVTMFNTDSYAARLYQHENDLLYVFSSQALFHRGQRVYMLLHYKSGRFIDWWAKFGLTVYEDQQVIGTGLNQIQGDLQSEVGFQVRVRL